MIRGNAPCFIVLLLAAILALPLQAQFSRALLRLANASKAPEMKVGTPLLLEINIEGNAEYAWKLKFDGTAERWVKHGPILIDSQYLPKGQEKITSVLLHAILAQSGKVLIPPLVLFNEASKQEIATNPLELEARSQIGPQEKDAPWILPPLPFGDWNMPLVYGVIALFAVFFLLGCYAIYRILRRRRPMQAKTAVEIVVGEIKDLEKILQSHPQLGVRECKTISFTLSAALRRYCSYLLANNLLDLTDDEFLQEIAALGLEKKFRSDLAAIFEAISEVRYSTKTLAAAPAKELLERCIRLVEEMQQAKELAANPKKAGKK